MKAIQTLIMIGAVLALSGCVATKIVTAPVRVAGDVVEGTAKGTWAAGSGAVDMVNGDDEDQQDD